MIYRSHDGDTATWGYTNALKYQVDSNEDPFTQLQGTLISAHPRCLATRTQPDHSFRVHDYSAMLNNEGQQVYDSLTFSPVSGSLGSPGDGRTNVAAYYGRFYKWFLEISSLSEKLQEVATTNGTPS